MNKFQKITLVLFGQTLAASSASAAVLYNTTYSAPISNILAYQNSPDSFNIELHGIAVGHPLFPLWYTYGPQPVGYNPPINYKITITTPSPIMNFQSGFGVADWYEEYATVNGIVTGIGGNDNIPFGGAAVQCDLGFFNCPISQPSTNKVSFDFTWRPTYSWSDESGYEIFPGVFALGTTDFTWVYDSAIYGQLPVADLDKSFTLNVIASTIPEPATWLILIFGFSAVGFVLRRSRPNEDVGAHDGRQSASAKIVGQFR